MSTSRTARASTYRASTGSSRPVQRSTGSGLPHRYEWPSPDGSSEPPLVPSRTVPRTRRVPPVTSAAFTLRPATRRRIRYILIGAAVLGAIIGLDTLVLHLRVDPLADVRAYYDAGARLNAGQPLYVQPATTDDAAFYRYPPLLAIAFRPLALLPFEVAAAIWEVVVVVSFGLTVVRLGIRQERTWLLLGWLAPAIAWSIAIGQAQVPITLLLAIGSPLAVALAANLKLLPALVAI